MAIAVVSVPTPAIGQAIVLNPNEVLPELIADTSGTTAFYINGIHTYGLTKNANEKRLYSSDAITKLILSLVTLRLSDAGVISLEAQVSEFVPHIVSANPFEAPITIRHLLQETAGFASPPLSLTQRALDTAVGGAQLERFAIKLRSAGQASTHDPVGWAVLIAVLEQVTGKPVSQLMTNQLTDPLGLDVKNVLVSYNRLAGESMPLGITTSLSSFAEIVRPLIRNIDKAGAYYLKQKTHKALVEGVDGFKLHPGGKTASLGVSVRSSNYQHWSEGLNTVCTEKLTFTAFPKQGVAFIGAVSGGPPNMNSCTPSLVRLASLKQAAKYFPPTKHNATGATLAQPSRLEGRYIPARRSPAALSERLQIMRSNWYTIYGDTGDQLLMKHRDNEPNIFKETAPYLYENNERRVSISTAMFSPYKLGGYLQLEGKYQGDMLYRRVDSLGRAGLLATMIPWALLVIASAVIYAVRQPDKPWRNMGLFALAGVMLVGGGLYLEINNWASVLYEKQQPVLITLWRTGLNIGLMLLLSLPLFVFSFSRSKTIPTDGLKILVAPHLALVAAAALMVFLTLVMWGVAGTFTPY